MSSYNYSYNVLINRFEAFAAGHLLIKRFTHGQIDLSDQLNDDEYPFMHVTPDTIEPTKGAIQFGFHVMFADIPRDKEYKAEYQREVISDCVRLGQDLIAEIQNGLELFGFNVQLVNDVVFEPFMEEQKNTVTGVAFTVKLEVPWDWSACDIPAVWAVGGTSTGGSGTGLGLLLQTNSVDNVVQSKLNLVEGTNVTLTDNGDGSVTIDATGGGGGGGGTVTSVGLSAPAAFTVSGSPVTTSGTLTLTAAGNNTQYIDGSGALQSFPTIPSQLNDLSDVNAPTPSNGQVLTWNGTAWVNITPAIGGTVTSVGLTMPNAFTVAGSPVTTAGTLAVTGAGTAAQYVRGDGTLANFPTSTGGGSSVSYYLNGSVSQGTIGGSTYYQMSKTPVLGAGTDFTRTNAQGNGLIAQFITDANDPNVLSIPGGNFNLELFFSASSSGGSPSYYVELYKYDGSTFTLLATDVATPEGITGGTVIDAYFTALAVPTTAMAITDRLAIRVFVTTSGRTITLHTENSHLCQIITTLSTGVNAINGLTAQVQNLTVGTSGTDFTINSAASTHTFNLPNASALSRGALSSADWSTFNGKQNNIGLTTVGTNLATLPNPSAVRYLRINASNGVDALTLAQLRTDLGLGASVVATNVTNVGTGFEDVTGLSFTTAANKTYKWRATISFTATAAITFSSNGPATSINNARFTSSLAATTNAVSNQTAYDSGTNAAAAGNGLCTADGIVRTTAAGTFTIRFRCATAALLTVRAGSIIEFEEVL